MAKQNPDDRKYTKEHEWIKADGTMGITDHAQELLTDIVYVELPEIGKEVEQMKPFCVVESVKSVSDVYAPVSGTVSDANKELSELPQKINEDAFSAWIAKIKIEDEKELNDLMSAKDYDEYIKADSNEKEIDSNVDGKKEEVSKETKE